MKLKEIPSNTAVHTPTEAEARELLAILHENGYKWCGNSKYNLLDTNWWNTDDMCYIIKPQTQIVGWSTRFSLTIHSLEKPTFLTLAEFKERYCEMTEQLTEKAEESSVIQEKPQPKFKVGDKVKVIEPNCWHSGQIGIVRKARTSSEQVMVAFGESGAANFYSEECLEPYTEPETKDDAKDTKEETMETKEEAKELNLCELLKGHEGETFYSPIVGDCTLKTITDYIYVAVNDHPSYCFFLDGRREKSGAVVFYPSRALYEQYPLDPYTAWMKWQEEQKKPFICIHWGEADCNGDIKEEDYTGNTYFRTASDRDKCIEEIKAIVNKYSK